MKSGRGMLSTVAGSSALAVAGRLVSANSATSPRSVHGPTVRSLPSSGRGRRNPPRLDHETALRLVAGVEQHLPAIDVAGLRADRQNAQGRPSQETERRHAFEEGNVVVDGHGRRRYGTNL